MDEIIRDEEPEQDSDSDVAPEVKPIEAAHSSPAPPPKELPVPYLSHDWLVLRMKNINCIPAKFLFDRDDFPGYDTGHIRIIACLSQIFNWTAEQLAWFLGSMNILWTLSYGGVAAKKNGKVYYECVTGKTKILGMLPFRLFPGLRRQGNNNNTSGAPIFTKALITHDEALTRSYESNVPADWNWSKKQLVVEVFFGGSANAALPALHDTFKNMAPADPNRLRERVEQWGTGQ